MRFFLRYRFFGASLILHALFAAYLIAQSNRSTRDLAKDTPLELEIAQNQSPQKIKAPTRIPDQIVENDPDLLPYDESEDAEYLGEKNFHTNQETVSEKIGQFKNDSESSTRSEASTQAYETEESAVDTEKAADLDGALVTSTKASESNAANDGVDNKQFGLKTLLNTREFTYFSYYQKIKAQISEHWEARIKDKISKLLSQGRDPASRRESVTRLYIHLGKSGELIAVQILGVSGTDELDQAAIEAFRAATPFPPPPPGIADSRGIVKIKWDFVLESRPPTSR